jgi:peptide/nickel transport system ATP-binding protein
MTDMLSLRRLNKVFTLREGLRTRRVHAVNDVDLTLSQGEVVALVGESGSGKSTIAKLIARLLTPTGGEILFDGQPTNGSLAFRSQVQMIFQDPFGSLNPIHTIRHHLERPLKRHGHSPDQVLSILRTVGLTPPEQIADKYPSELSGGQRQRVAIARALAVQPRLILADEPTSMLDVSIRVDILNLLLRLKREQGIGYLYITHDLASARYFADRILVLYAGHVVESGPSAELMASPKHPYTRVLLAAVPDATGARTDDIHAKPGGAKLVDPGPGCPFAMRCPLAEDRCHTHLPALRMIGSDRKARCHIL